MTEDPLQRSTITTWSFSGNKMMPGWVYARVCSGSMPFRVMTGIVYLLHKGAIDPVGGGGVGGS